MINSGLLLFTTLAEYAQVTEMLGDCRLNAICVDGKKRLCRIRGALRYKVWIGVGDTILIGLRDYQDAKADVIQKYTMEEVYKLRECEELPETGKYL